MVFGADRATVEDMVEEILAIAVEAPNALERRSTLPATNAASEHSDGRPVSGV
jgi:hypothetical protein